MNIEINNVEIPGLLLIKPKVFEDERGYFFESYNKNTFNLNGLDLEFRQDNQSVSKKNVLRGLHFQNPPYEQGKLIRVAKGSALDVAVDIRKESVSYGKYYSIVLSEKNNYLLWIPPGFAHGFLTLEDETIFIYKCTNLYNKDSERAILWNDPDIKIKWPTENPIVSEKDRMAERFRDFKSIF